MSKLAGVINVPAPPDTFKDLKDAISYLDDLSKSIQHYIEDIYEEFNGKIDLVNQRVAQVTISDTGAANTEFAVTHNLGVVPTYYLWNINKSGVVYKGTTAWTTTNIYLKCSVANAEVKIVVFR